MTKHEYLGQLTRELRRLPKEEIDRVISYYEEYFDEAGEENFASAVEELGSPVSIAPQIMRDAAIRNTNQPAKSVRSSVQTVWIMILALFAAPIGLPMGFALVVLLGALTLTALLLVASVVLASIACAVGGVVGIVMGLMTLFTHGVVGIMPLGVGMLAAGAGVIGLYLMIVCGKWILLGVARLFQKKVMGRKAK